MTERVKDLGPLVTPVDPMATDCYRANMACAKEGIGQNDVLRLGKAVSDSVRDAFDTGNIDFIGFGRAAAEGFAVETLSVSDDSVIAACGNLGAVHAQWLVANLPNLK